MGSIWIIVILIICPFLVGKLVTEKLSLKDKLSESLVFPLGFFVEIALFEMIAFPFAWMRIPTSVLTFFYTGILLTISIYSFHKYKPFSFSWIWPKGMEWLYVAVFTGLFIWQLYNAIILDFTVKAADDATYVTLASDAVTNNKMFVIDPSTGIAGRFNVHRAMQTSLVFPSILSILSNIPVVTIEHTILQVFYLTLAYSVYHYMSDVLFESFDNKMIFMILVSLFYIYGYYSEYNTTFRLLMPNYQGKAVLAVSLTPLLFTLIIELLEQDFGIKAGFLLTLLSIAAVSLSLIGAVTVVVVVGLPVTISVISKNIKVQHLLYIPMVAAFPAFCASIYMIYHFAL